MAPTGNRMACVRISRRMEHPMEKVAGIYGKCKKAETVGDPWVEEMLDLVEISAPNPIREKPFLSTAGRPDHRLYHGPNPKGNEHLEIRIRPSVLHIPPLPAVCNQSLRSSPPSSRQRESCVLFTHSPTPSLQVESILESRRVLA
jgi:hypothetical protein